MSETPPSETGRSSPDSPPDAAVTKPRKRRTIPMLVLASIIAIAVAALTVRGLAAPSHEKDGDRSEAVSERMHHGEEGGEEEEKGGPTAPAEYLTRKFTSGQDVKPGQIKQAITQAKAIKPG
ncbi:MAG: hypothetical protein ACJ72W_08020, partial [Actinoallomurus sp.]